MTILRSTFYCCHLIPGTYPVAPSRWPPAAAVTKPSNENVLAAEWKRDRFAFGRFCSSLQFSFAVCANGCDGNLANFARHIWFPPPLSSSKSLFVVCQPNTLPRDWMCAKLFRNRLENGTERQLLLESFWNYHVIGMWRCMIFNFNHPTGDRYVTHWLVRRRARCLLTATRISRKYLGFIRSRNYSSVTNVACALFRSEWIW